MRSPKVSKPQSPSKGMKSDPSGRWARSPRGSPPISARVTCRPLQLPCRTARRARSGVSARTWTGSRSPISRNPSRAACLEEVRERSSRSVSRPAISRSGVRLSPSEISSLKSAASFSGWGGNTCRSGQRTKARLSGQPVSIPVPRAMSFTAWSDSFTFSTAMSGSSSSTAHGFSLHAGFARRAARTPRSGK